MTLSNKSGVEYEQIDGSAGLAIALINLWAIIKGVVNLPPLALRHIWLLCPLALVFIVGNTQGTAFQSDLWWQLVHGRHMVETGRLIQTDPFTHTIAGRRISNPTWLAQYAFYAIHRAGGVKLLTLVITCVYTAGFALLAWLCWKRSGSCRIAAVCCLVAVSTSLQNVATRAQAFSVLFFVVELVILWRFAGRWWAPLVIGGMMALWTNSHGAFPLGVILPLIFLCGSLLTPWFKAVQRPAAEAAPPGRFVICACAALAAAFCKPQPLSVLEYIGGTASLAMNRQLQEWLPPDPRSLTSIMAFVSLGLALVILNLSRRRLDAAEMLLIFGFIFLSHSSARMVVWWGVVLAPILAPHLASIFTSYEEPQRTPGAIARLVNLLLAAYVCGGAMLSVPWNRWFNPFVSSPREFELRINEPHAVVEHLQSRPDVGRIYNPMGWGGYLSWHLDKKLKVFIDERINLFPDQVWEDYASVALAREGWPGILDRHGVSTVVAGTKISPRLVQAARQSPLWREVHSDPLASIFERAAPAPQAP